MKMEEIIVILLFTALIAAWLQCSLLSRWFGLVLGLSLAFFSYLIYPLTIEQNSFLIQKVLQNKVLLQNLALVQVLEAVILLLVHMLILLPQYYSPNPPSGGFRKGLQKAVFFFPGVVLFPAVFYFQLRFFLLDTGLDFSEAAIAFAVLTVLITAAGPVLFKFLLQQKELRLELKFFIHLLQIGLAVIINASQQSAGDFSSHQSAPLMPLLTVSLVMAAGVFTGYFLYNRKLKKQRK